MEQALAEARQKIRNNDNTPGDMLMGRVLPEFEESDYDLIIGDTFFLDHLNVDPIEL